MAEARDILLRIIAQEAEMEQAIRRILTALDLGFNLLVHSKSRHRSVTFSVNPYLRSEPRKPLMTGLVSTISVQKLEPEGRHHIQSDWTESMRE